MSLSSFLTEAPRTIVIDASVVINLNATECAAEILDAVPSPFVVTDNVRAELRFGSRNGHDDEERLKALVDGGAVGSAALDAKGLAIYETLISGSAAMTLDDGEAATIACAVQMNGIAMIDERKARKICASRFGSLPVVSTAELLADGFTETALGPQRQIEAIIAALQGARMRVPPEHIEMVVGLIGASNAASCLSLPRKARAAS
ncbi:MAG: hypothetical protein AB7I79_15535 [Rhizobiaceae bacterium]